MKKYLAILLAIGLFVIGGCAVQKGWTIAYTMGPIAVTFQDHEGRFSKGKIREMLLPYFPDPKAVEEETVDESDEKVPEKEI